MKPLPGAAAPVVGTVLDAGRCIGHIRDPVTGRPVAPLWKAVTMTARSAALSDARSTAACLCAGEGEIVSMPGRFDGARLVQALR